MLANGHGVSQIACSGHRRFMHAARCKHAPTISGLARGVIVAGQWWMNLRGETAAIAAAAATAATTTARCRAAHSGCCFVPPTTHWTTVEALCDRDANAMNQTRHQQLGDVIDAEDTDHRDQAGFKIGIEIHVTILVI